MRVILAIFTAIFIAGCAIKSDYEVKQLSYAEPSWYKGYEDAQLELLVRKALENNKDIKTAVLNLQTALLSAGLKKSDFLPSLNVGASASVSRDLNAQNGWGKNFAASLSLSYEIDLFLRVYDGYESAFWSAKNSEATLAALRLTLINSVVSGYFNVAYLNDVRANLEANLANQKKLLNIAEQKYRLGSGDALAVSQARSNIFSLQNQLFENSRSLAESSESLANLVGERVNLPKATLANVKLRGVSLDAVGYERLSKRPDVNAAAAALNAAFYDYKASVKSLYPSITIGASLGKSGERVQDAFGFSMFNGNLQINLPFLNYHKVKNNVKISEFSFEKQRISYESALSEAANEVVKYAKFWELDKERAANLAKMEAEDRKILAIYTERYRYGKSEFSYVVNAQNSLLSTQNSLLAAKQRLLSDELAYFKAIGE